MLGEEVSPQWPFLENITYTNPLLLNALSFSVCSSRSATHDDVHMVEAVRLQQDSFNKKLFSQSCGCSFGSVQSCSSWGLGPSHTREITYALAKTTQTSMSCTALKYIEM